MGAWAPCWGSGGTALRGREGTDTPHTPDTEAGAAP